MRGETRGGDAAAFLSPRSLLSSGWQNVEGKADSHLDSSTGPLPHFIKDDYGPEPRLCGELLPGISRPLSSSSMPWGAVRGWSLQLSRLLGLVRPQPPAGRREEPRRRKPWGLSEVLRLKSSVSREGILASLERTETEGQELSQTWLCRGIPCHGDGAWGSLLLTSHVGMVLGVSTGPSLHLVLVGMAFLRGHQLAPLSTRVASSTLPKVERLLFLL